MNDFTRHGVGEEEFASALEEALRLGGADESEIREARMGVAVDAAMAGEPQVWRLHPDGEQT